VADLRQIEGKRSLFIPQIWKNEAKSALFHKFEKSKRSELSIPKIGRSKQKIRTRLLIQSRILTFKQPSWDGY
jgi:hypothetical protein